MESIWCVILSLVMINQIFTLGKGVQVLGCSLT